MRGDPDKYPLGLEPMTPAPLTAWEYLSRPHALTLIDSRKRFNSIEFYQKYRMQTDTNSEPNRDYDLNAAIASTSGLRQGLTSYGDAHFSLFLRKVFIKALGYSEDALSRPIVGIINTFSGFNPCHANVPQLIEAAKRGVQLSGGLAVEFPTISVHESFSHPTSMFLRNLMSMDTEEMIKAQPLDACIMIGGKN